MFFIDVNMSVDDLYIGNWEKRKKKATKDQNSLHYLPAALSLRNDTNHHYAIILIAVNALVLREKR